MQFKDWLNINEGSNPGAKTGIYPLSYGGIALYPPQWYLTRSADAIFYLSIDDRIYNFKNNKIVNKHLNSGEGGLWNIEHIPGNKDNPKSTKGGFSANFGEGGMWNINHIKGKPTCNKNKNYIPNKGEGGMWNIKHIKH